MNQPLLYLILQPGTQNDNQLSHFPRLKRVVAMDLGLFCLFQSFIKSFFTSGLFLFIHCVSLMGVNETGLNEIKYIFDAAGTLCSYMISLKPANGW